MSTIYELIGRAVVRVIRVAYGEQIRNAAIVGGGIAAIAAVAYVAVRNGESEE